MLSMSKGGVSCSGEISSNLSPLVEVVRRTIDRFGSEPIHEFFGARVQSELKAFGQQIETRMFGLWPRFSLKLIDVSCPSNGTALAPHQWVNSASPRVRRNELDRPRQPLSIREP